MLGFGKRLEAYTESKCIYSRSMDTCVLEMLYWTNQTRQIMQETRLCFEDCDSGKDPNTCKQVCMKDSRAKYTEVQDMTEQMIQISKAELSEAASATPSDKL
mmetsp:Transcript_19139/g.22571  ORF Transcript_19139/g.22571 Transcript_19139/m.22571 type:complete len:102 (+) Transcript_19139:62-367(+)